MVLRLAAGMAGIRSGKATQYKTFGQMWIILLQRITFAFGALCFVSCASAFAQSTPASDRALDPMAEAITCIAGIDCSKAPANLTKDELSLVLGLDEADARRIYERDYKNPKPVIEGPQTPRKPRAGDIPISYGDDPAKPGRKIPRIIFGTADPDQRPDPSGVWRWTNNMHHLSIRNWGGACTGEPASTPAPGTEKTWIRERDGSITEGGRTRSWLRTKLNMADVVLVTASCFPEQRTSDRVRAWLGADPMSLFPYMAPDGSLFLLIHGNRAVHVDTAFADLQTVVTFWERVKPEQGQEQVDFTKPGAGFGRLPADEATEKAEEDPRGGRNPEPSGLIPSGDRVANLFDLSRPEASGSCAAVDRLIAAAPLLGNPAITQAVDLTRNLFEYPGRFYTPEECEALYDAFEYWMYSAGMTRPVDRDSPPSGGPCQQFLWEAAVYSQQLVYDLSLFVDQVRATVREDLKALRGANFACKKGLDSLADRGLDPGKENVGWSADAPEPQVARDAPVNDYRLEWLLNRWIVTFGSFSFEVTLLPEGAFTFAGQAVSTGPVDPSTCAGLAGAIGGMCRSAADGKLDNLKMRVDLRDFHNTPNLDISSAELPGQLSAVIDGVRVYEPVRIIQTAEVLLDVRAEIRRQTGASGTMTNAPSRRPSRQLVNPRDQSFAPAYRTGPPHVSGTWGTTYGFELATPKQGKDGKARIPSSGVLSISHEKPGHFTAVLTSRFYGTRHCPFDGGFYGQKICEHAWAHSDLMYGRFMGTFHADTSEYQGTGVLNGFPVRVEIREWDWPAHAQLNRFNYRSLQLIVLPPEDDYSSVSKERMVSLLRMRR